MSLTASPIGLSTSRDALSCPPGLVPTELTSAPGLFVCSMSTSVGKKWYDRIDSAVAAHSLMNALGMEMVNKGLMTSTALAAITTSLMPALRYPDANEDCVLYFMPKQGITFCFPHSWVEEYESAVIDGMADLHTRLEEKADEARNMANSFKAHRDRTTKTLTNYNVTYTKTDYSRASMGILVGLVGVALLVW
jgi:hypothetical protein